MRIAISGTASQGKSTLLKDFLEEWPVYSTPDNTYRDLLTDKEHSKSTTEDTQWNILNQMVDVLQENGKTSSNNVIFDRCPLDNIVYSLWAHEKGHVSKEFIDKCIPIVKESLRSLDIIFFIPLTKAHTVPIVDDGTRETDSEYIKEIDNIFKAMAAYYYQDTGPFFVHDDKPAIIEVFGEPLARLEIIKLYIDADGDSIGEQGILDPGEISLLEQQFGINK